ncbi:hypothetical protein AB4876_09330 [Zhongshania guokunii]|uniref:Uncharacterized protein n=1 Tax=Zhongshania guokunii TaxID=641783 RepID=A0ABV3U576_9GAMM
MNVNQVIDAARTAIVATGMDVKTSSRSSTELLLGVRGNHRHRVFGPATPLVCWTQAFEYATGKPWWKLLTQWHPQSPPIFKPQRNNRGELKMLAGTPLEVEKQLAELEQSNRLLSATYSPRRRGQVVTITHAEVL